MEARIDGLLVWLCSIYASHWLGSLDGVFGGSPSLVEHSTSAQVRGPRLVCGERFGGRDWVPNWGCQLEARLVLEVSGSSAGECADSCR